MKHCDVLLDLHTASFGRTNPHYVRACMTHPVVARLALLQVRSLARRRTGLLPVLTTLCMACCDGQGAQIIAHSGGPRCSLRAVATSAGVPTVRLACGIVAASVVPLTGMRHLASGRGLAGVCGARQPAGVPERLHPTSATRCVVAHLRCLHAAWAALTPPPCLCGVCLCVCVCVEGQSAGKTAGLLRLKVLSLRKILRLRH